MSKAKECAMFVGNTVRETKRGVPRETLHLNGFTSKDIAESLKAGFIVALKGRTGGLFLTSVGEQATGITGAQWVPSEGDGPSLKAAAFAVLELWLKNPEKLDRDAVSSLVDSYKVELANRKNPQS